eukprot:scaffold2.g6896.t1
MSLFVPTKFIWRFGGSVVHLCGSFTRWVETVPMAPVEGQQGVYSVVVHLPPGYHQYKFIVDGEWRHDEAQPFMPDPLGNVNNWLFVRKPDGGSGGTTPTAAAAAGGGGGPGPSPAIAVPASHRQQQQQHAAAAAAAHHPAAMPAQGAFLQGAGGGGGGGALAAPAAGLGAAAPPGHRPPQAGAATAPSSRAHSVADMEVSVAGGLPPGEPSGGGVDGGVLAPIALQADEPGYTRKKVADFLNAHTAYELIPEGIASAPLWDGATARVCGMLSASDFIQTLQRLRSVVAGAAPMSEGEMDRHTIRSLRQDLEETSGRPLKPLVSVRPQDSLGTVVRTLLETRCSAAPLLHRDAAGSGTDGSSAEGGAHAGGVVLHTATTAGVLACLMRHFRASLASLPLLAQPLGAVPVGTWDEGSPLGAADAGGRRQQRGGGGGERWDERRVARLQTALGVLLEGGISCLPVVNDSGTLLDIYARADITTLAKAGARGLPPSCDGSAYARLQYEDVTVGQALSLAAAPAPPPQAFGGASAASASGSASDLAHARQQQRVHMSVVERLSVPGVRRLVAVDPETRRVQGIVSLSDVAAYLLL